MQGNRDDHNCAHGYRLLQAGNRLRQYPPQNRRRGSNLLELEHMDQVAQSAVIAAIGDCSLEGRTHALTKQAPCLSLTAIRLKGIHAGCTMQRFPTNGAERPLERSKGEHTGFTNGGSGNSK